MPPSNTERLRLAFDPLLLQAKLVKFGSGLADSVLWALKAETIFEKVCSLIIN